MTLKTFSQRLAHRRRLWWDPPWPGRGRGVGDASHRLRERRVFRSREDPDEVWRCCERWPRTLLNKWNGREFAARHGCDMPQLYWSGSDHARAPLETLPAEFVIRPVFGAMKRGVVVVAGDRELLRDEKASLAEVRAMLPRSRILRRPRPVLVEEMIRPRADEVALPIEFKLHTFADRVELIERIVRVAALEGRHRYYTPDWTPIADPINTFLDHDDAVSHPPSGLDLMLRQASALGAELGTYMRIDFFAAERGPVFNEFSSLPLLGRRYTPAGEELLGRFWLQHCPDAI